MLPSEYILQFNNDSLLLINVSPSKKEKKVSAPKINTVVSEIDTKNEAAWFEAISASLKRLADEKKFLKPVNVLLPTFPLLYKSFLVPNIKGFSLYQAVDFHVKQFFPLLSDSFFSFIVLNENRSSLHILACFIKNDWLEKLKCSLANAKIPMGSVIPPAFVDCHFLIRQVPSSELNSSLFFLLEPDSCKTYFIGKQCIDLKTIPSPFTENLNEASYIKLIDKLFKEEEIKQFVFLAASSFREEKRLKHFSNYAQKEYLFLTFDKSNFYSECNLLTSKLFYTTKFLSLSPVSKKKFILNKYLTRFSFLILGISLGLTIFCFVKKHNILRVNYLELNAVSESFKNNNEIIKKYLTIRAPWEDFYNSINGKSQAPISIKNHLIKLNLIVEAMDGFFIEEMQATLEDGVTRVELLGTIASVIEENNLSVDTLSVKCKWDAFLEALLKSYPNLKAVRQTLSQEQLNTKFYLNYTYSYDQVVG